MYGAKLRLFFDNTKLFGLYFAFPCKLFQYIFLFPLSLKLHGDVGISASGRNFWGIYKVLYQILFRFSVEFIRTRKKFFRKKILCARNKWGENAEAECYCDHDF